MQTEPPRGDAPLSTAAREAVAAAYEAARADPNVTDMMASFCHKYRHSLPGDAGEDAARLALWRACLTHEDCHGNKFTNSLWKYLTWEFDRTCESERRQAGPRGGGRCRLDAAELPIPAPPPVDDHPADGEAAAELVAFIRRRLPRAVAAMVEARHLRGATYRDLAATHGLTPSAARERVKWGLARLRFVAADD
jgi:DNA-directed RNA polymerase specialized sigma24 family protein